MNETTTVEMTDTNPEASAIPSEGVTEAENPVEQATANPEITEESGTSDGEDATADVPKKGGVSKRIDELTANWRGAERDRDYWRDLALKNQQEPQQQAQEPQQQPQGAPTLEQFDNYDDFVVAKAKHELQQDLKQQEQARREQEQQQVYQQSVQNFQQRVQEAKTRHADFESVAYSAPLSPAMEEVILNSENGPEMAYHLGINKQEAARIANLPPMVAAMEMAKVEMKVTAPPPPTQTPDPISTVESGGSHQKDPSQMSINEWMEWRNKSA